MQGDVTSLSDLREVEEEVQALLPMATQALVVLHHDGGTASGVIVSPDGLILTAAHVTEEPGQRMSVVLPDGSPAAATTLGLDTATDAGMAKLKGRRKDWPYVELRRQTGLTRVGEWCFALGHPGGWDKARGPVLRVGRVLKHSANGLQTDCVLMGGDSGGPLFDLRGRVIGIHSQIWEGREQNMHISLAPFLRAWEALKGSQVIRTWATGSGGYLGLVTGYGEGGVLIAEEVLEESPAAVGGLKAGDALLKVGSTALLDDRHFSALIRQRPPGDLVEIRIRRGEREQTLEVKLGQRPLPSIR